MLPAAEFFDGMDIESSANGRTICCGAPPVAARRCAAGLPAGFRCRPRAPVAGALMDAGDLAYRGAVLGVDDQADHGPAWPAWPPHGDPTDAFCLL